jgi:hypothetical protein
MINYSIKSKILIIILTVLLVPVVSGQGNPEGQDWDFKMTVNTGLNASEDFTSGSDEFWVRTGCFENYHDCESGVFDYSVSSDGDLKNDSSELEGLTGDALLEFENSDVHE